ncbi:hypothetical protein ACOSQ2_003954 [Xanthoceras sorbifolium]
METERFKGVEGSIVDKRNDTGNNQGVPSSRNRNVVERFRKGTVTVAGDSVVLVQCLARKMMANLNMYHDMKGVEEGIDEYVKERRMRLVQLSTQTYLMGSLVDSWSSTVRFMIILLLALFFRDPFGHNPYNVGRL